MKKVTEEFLEDVIKRNVSVSRLKDSRTGAMIEKERVDVKAIVKEVMKALRTKRRKTPVKKKTKKKVKKNVRK